MAKIARRIENDTYANLLFHALLFEDNDYSIFYSHYNVDQLYYHNHFGIIIKLFWYID